MSPTCSFAEKPVLIVGAGLRGLCLAQASKKHNIPFKLFERDFKRDFRAQGSFGGRFNVLTVEPLPAGGGPPAGAYDKMRPYTVDRTTMCEVLLTNLDREVSYGKLVISGRQSAHTPSTSTSCQLALYALVHNHFQAHIPLRLSSGFETGLCGLFSPSVAKLAFNLPKTNEMILTTDIPSILLKVACMIGHTPLKAVQADPRASYPLYILPTRYDTTSNPVKLPLLVWLHGIGRKLSALYEELVSYADTVNTLRHSP
ncbi:hypothetical protein TSTA_040960 [Talaromyces stipitatus ATCC 10500]|uniref:Uncharacterized protein n=1 Tax=Talaromyces stipitatus (strain ATCC 10500 / CBS 375.48 / QM 6759 / NRRL 1006) TaxID=441959 RepID=B8MID3_TALSN|nr:uncharacterized protein TSTA_040960 [Talaromyces stipitatus ATCC 10500]EED14617.1 hypothetical protein TSTA_040960 [Talaromyces stipitatus ATCC 10500]